MLVPDLELTWRLERHEACSGAAHAEAQARRYPQTGALVRRFDGGWAVYCGRRAPVSGVFGWGLGGPVAEEELEAMAEIYRSRGLPMHVRVSPLADPAAVALLGARGYVVKDFMNVYARELGPLALEPLAGAPHVPGVEIRVATEAEARLWFTRNGAGGDWAEPDGVSFMTVRCALKEGARLFVAWVGDEPAGAGGLEVHEGVAALMAAATLPAYRGRGIHGALLHARLAAAVADGCDLAMVHTSPGTPSQRNVLRAGFALMYTAPTVVGGIV